MKTKDYFSEKFYIDDFKVLELLVGGRGTNSKLILYLWKVKNFNESSMYNILIITITNFMKFQNIIL